MPTPFDSALAAYFDAYAAQDAAGCAAAFTDGATLYIEGRCAAGRDAIAALHDEWFGAGETDKTWQVDDFKSDGFNGFCLIRFAASLPDGSRLHGATLAAMEHVEGAWLIRQASLTTHPEDTAE